MLRREAAHAGPKRGPGFPGLTDRVRDRIYNHVFDNDEGEVGGVLVGRSDDGTAVLTGSIPALEAQGARASVTFTHDAWTKVHSTLERDFPGMEIVGWYHSHPGFGIFLSNHDMFIHENFFSGPSQIAYVIDPHAGTEGVFGWQDGKVELFYESKTDRQGTRGRHRPSSAGGAASPPGSYPLSGLIAPLVIGVVLGLAGWFALDGGSASSARKSQQPNRGHRVPGKSNVERAPRNKPPGLP